MSLFQVMFRCGDALTTEGLEGAVYELSHCGRALQSVRSDARGICCFDGVAPGVYCLRESIAPPGYQRNPRFYRCVMDCFGCATVGGVPAHRAMLINFPGCANGGLPLAAPDTCTAAAASGFRVHRLSADGQPVAGCVLTLHSESGLREEAVSGDDGIAEFYGLAPGSYTLAERANPDGPPLAVRHAVHITAQGMVRINGVRTESITMR